jgi:hypothetical protein
MPYQTQPITPPASAGLDGHCDLQNGTSAQSTMIANGQQQPMSMPGTSMAADQITWNPKGIFE